MHIRPLLEYASSVLLPSDIAFCELLLCVQRIFAKRIAGLLDMPHAERLAVLVLPTLRQRWLYYNMVQVFKRLHGLTVPVMDL